MFRGLMLLRKSIYSFVWNASSSSSLALCGFYTCITQFNSNIDF